MAFLVGKAYHFVLYAGAVARSDAVYAAVVKGRKLLVVQYYFFCFRGGIGEVATAFGGGYAVVEIGKRLCVRFAALLHRPRKINRIQTHTRGSTGLEAAHLKPQSNKTFRQTFGVGKPVGTTVANTRADNRPAVEIHAATQHHCLCAVSQFHSRFYHKTAVVLHRDVHNFALSQCKVGRVFDGLFHVYVVLVFVHLRTRRIHRRPFAAVEHAHLQQTFVGIYRHFATKSVYFLDDLTLCRAPYTWIARQKSHRVQIGGKQQRVAVHSCGGKGGFTSCVPRTDNDYVKLFHTFSYLPRQNLL